MTIELDHVLVPARDRVASARLLADLLDLPWSEATVGPFAAVFVNDGLTLDFDTWDEPLPRIHYCFRVAPDAFDAILSRLDARGIAYRSRVGGPVDRAINRQQGGKNVYWDEPDGHYWEMLTISYARRQA